MRSRSRILLKGTLFATLLLAACFFLFQAWAYSDDDGLTWYKLYYTQAQKMQALRVIKELGGRAPEYFPDVARPYIVAQIGPEEALAYFNQGFRLEEIPDYDPKHTGSAVRSDRGIPSYDCYRTVAETIAAMQQLDEDGGVKVSLNDIGDSYLKSTGQGGEDIWALRMPNNRLGYKPTFMVTGGVHAREYVGPELALRFAEYLTANMETDPDVWWIVNLTDIWIIPLVNPDGRKMADGTIDQILWRKNMHKHNNNDCQPWPDTHYGTDLNRNFKYKWNTTGTSDDICNELYHGESAVSEPESKALRNLFLSRFEDYNTSPTSPASSDAKGLYIDLHSYSQLVLWSWGYDVETKAPNHAQLRSLGRKFAFFNNYEPQTAAKLYEASGGTTDDLYAERGIPAYTFEMGTAFFQGCTAFNNTIAPQNLKALIYAAKASHLPYKIPKGPDVLNVALNGTTLTATIDDTRYKNGEVTLQDPAETTQNITAAEYYIDQFPYRPEPFTPHAMTASDGSFNSKTENVRATINTNGLSKGRHIIYVRGKDAGNNWGIVSAVFLTVN